MIFIGYLIVLVAYSIPTIFLTVIGYFSYKKKKK